MNLIGWWPVYKREMKMLVRRIGGLGYLFSGLLFPMIYLLAFGWGLGNRINLPGGYIPFLAKGMVAITIMMNSFQQTAISLSSARFYYRNFQTLKMCPIGEANLVLGLALAGVSRGIVAGLIIAITAFCFFDAVIFTPQAFIGMFLTALFFGFLGVAVGMSIKGQEQFSLIINFFITPMTFFCGSFFPLKELPPLVELSIKYFPLSLANNLIRAGSWEEIAPGSIFLLIVFILMAYSWSVYKMRKYSEF